jgi:chitodextrinase
MNVPTRRRAALAALGALTVLVGFGLSVAPAQAATPLPTPGTPVATNVTTTSLTFSWSASAGPVRNYTIQVIDGPLVPWHTLATTNATSYTHANLAPDTVYEYRVVANPRSGSGYTASNPSGILFARTAPLPDTIPPTKPGTPFAYQVSTTAATLNFAGSTDNVRVAGYVAQRQVNGVWTDWASNDITTIYLRDLTPNTSYTVVVVAFDPNGNRSPRSDPLTFTTRATAPAPACRVQRLVFGQAYLLNVTVENMTTATVLENWTFTFTLPAAHTITTIFNVTLARTGDAATATPAIWFNRISPGGSAVFGIGASYPVGSPLPGGFAVTSPGTGPFACTLT